MTDDEQQLEREAAEKATKWVIALVIALVALFGLVVLLAVAVAVLEPPRWFAMTAGIVLAIGATAFAWLVASALISADRDRQASQADVSPIDRGDRSTA